MDRSELTFQVTCRRERLSRSSSTSEISVDLEPYVHSETPLDTPGHSPFLVATEPESWTARAASRDDTIPQYLRYSVQDGPPIPYNSAASSVGSEMDTTITQEVQEELTPSKLLLHAVTPRSERYWSRETLKNLPSVSSPSSTTTPQYSPPISPFLPPPHPFAGFPLYEYIKLPAWTPNAIRLVRLHPMKQNPQTALEVVPHLSTELHWLDCHLPFCALSYCWGQTEDISELFDDDEQFLEDKRYEYEVQQLVTIVDGHILPVRKNLLDFLVTKAQELAQPDFVGHDLFWIDAICINQEDLDERNRQVGMMGTIYREAHQVLVWLGLDYRTEMEEVKYMMYQLLDMGKNLVKNAAEAKLDPKSHWTSVEKNRVLIEAGLPILEDVAWWPFCMFWNRSWFGRLWVLQEVAIARQILIVCGRTTFEIIDLETVGFVLGWGIDIDLGARMMRHRDNVKFRAVGRSIRTIGSITRWCQIGEAPFSQSVWTQLSLNGTTSIQEPAAVWNTMLHMCKSANSTLKIDRVYAIAGIVGYLTKASRRKQIVDVNYARSELEGRLRIFSYILHELQWLNPIASVQHVDGTIGQPSWLPDLATDGHTLHTHVRFNATLSLGEDRMTSDLPTFTLIDRKIRTVGHKLDTISALSGVLLNLPNRVLELLIELVLSTNGIYAKTQESRLKALWKTRIADSVDAVGDEMMHESFLSYCLHQYCRETLTMGRDTAEQNPDAASRQWWIDWFRDTFPAIGQLAVLEEEGRLSYENIVECAMRCGLSEEVPKEVAEANMQELFDAGQFFRRESGKFCSRHRVIVTVNGFIGLAPDLAQPGDEVWLLPRTTVPFILRPHPGDIRTSFDDAEPSDTESRAQRQLVGESYIHGVMHGEFFNEDRSPNIESLSLEGVDLI